jgi:hypothetical protein
MPFCLPIVRPDELQEPEIAINNESKIILMIFRRLILLRYLVTESVEKPLGKLHFGRH